jgi:hypothetical protein
MNIFFLSRETFKFGLVFTIFSSISDAGASQASQRGDNGLLEKHPAQILKYLEPLMKHQVEAHL